jgi:hypothetical protein
MASASSHDPHASRLASWRSTLVLVAIVLVAGSAAFAALLSFSRALALVAALVALAGAAWIVKARLIDHQRHPNYDKLLELGMAGIFIALMINIVTNVVQQGWIDSEPPTAEALYRNHDLSRLSGTVIKAILEKEPEDPADAADCVKDRAALASIAADAAEHWATWMEQSVSALDSAGVAQDALVGVVRKPTMPALNDKAWEKFLIHAAFKRGVNLGADCRRAAALRLSHEFGGILRETLKHDYAAGGDASKAFAAMQLDIMRELLDDSPRLTLYHLNGGRTSEITPEYTGVRQNDPMRVKADGVDGQHWYILTIDGAGNVGLFAPDQLSRDDNGLWAWEPTAPPTETILLLSCSHELSESEQKDVEDRIGSLPITPTLDAGKQVVWGDAPTLKTGEQIVRDDAADGDDRGWRLVEAGRGHPGRVERSGEVQWMTRVCDELRKINGLRFEGRTIIVTPLPVDAKDQSQTAPQAQG